MKVLMISSDRQVLSPDSAVFERMKAYGDLVEELHIVLLSDASHRLKETQLGKNVWVYPTNSMVKFARPFSAARLGKRLIYEKKFVRGEALITTQDPFECGWAGMKIKNKWRLPLEVQLHTDPFSKNFRGVLNNIRKAIAHKVLRQADHVRVVTEALKRITQPYTEAAIYVLPIYIEIKLLTAERTGLNVHNIYDWNFVILAVARLEPEKNLSLALKVLSEVRKKIPKTGMIIAGSGSEEGRLKALAKKLKLEGYVEFLGWKKDLKDFYKTSDLFIQTSDYEGYGMALVEAGLAGLPVVTTAVGIAQELENGKELRLCAFNNEDEFASAILELLNDKFKRENMGLHLKKTLEEKLFSREKYLSELKAKWGSAAKIIS